MNSRISVAIVKTMEDFFSTIITIIQILIVIALIAVVIFLFTIFRKAKNFRHKINVKFGLEAANGNGNLLTTAERSEILRHRQGALEKWGRIQAIISSEKEADLHLAIIKADSLIDEILKHHGCQGKDMGERLKSIGNENLKSLNELWEAHKVRNRLSHEPDFHISANDAKKIMNLYKKSLDELLSEELRLTA